MMHQPFFILFFLAPLVVIALLIALGAKMFSALFSSSRKEEDARQTETVQELYAGLSRLEDRLEVLETLILEPDPKENKT
jgi:phage shock protein B